VFSARSERATTIEELSKPLRSPYMERHLRLQEELKNGVFWDVTPCGSCKNRRFGGT
jgi:hypothetical protein